MPARAALQQALKELQVQERSIQKQIVALEKAIDTLTKQERHAPSSRRPRRPMSSAERRSVSARMKRYWAERRADKSSSST